MNVSGLTFSNELECKSYRGSLIKLSKKSLTKLTKKGFLFQSCFLLQISSSVP